MVKARGKLNAREMIVSPESCACANTAKCGFGLHQALKRVAISSWPSGPPVGTPSWGKLRVLGTAGKRFSIK